MHKDNEFKVNKGQTRQEYKRTYSRIIITKKTGEKKKQQQLPKTYSINTETQDRMTKGQNRNTIVIHSYTHNIWMKERDKQQQKMINREIKRGINRNNNRNKNRAHSTVGMLTVGFYSCTLCTLAYSISSSNSNNITTIS